MRTLFRRRKTTLGAFLTGARAWLLLIARIYFVVALGILLDLLTPLDEGQSLFAMICILVCLDYYDELDRKKQ